LNRSGSKTHCNRFRAKSCNKGVCKRYCVNVTFHKMQWSLRWSPKAMIHKDLF
jgi:hypothetical protein